ncbi:MAG: FKBP-type peptidyl-prolyl cis-trans isomerase [Methanophagales archaeon]|nr:FKBP-type peptidyl-prolyl cis-trans isomerase [Methanophagales archaeon]
MLTAIEGDYILVDYSERLEDGTVFDTSIESVAVEAEIYNLGREYKPLGFTVDAGEMIEGFDRGVVGMACWGERRLIIAYDEAYGAHCANRVMTIQIEKLTTAGIIPVVGKKIVTIHEHVGTIMIL